MPGLKRRNVLILGAALALAVLIAGLPLVNAPWLQGDEHIFIVGNPAVTGARVTPDTLGQRLALIFEFPPEEDLYQPLPILTYALQWTLAGNAPVFFRITDVALHAANAVLLWAVLYVLLRRSRPAAERHVLALLTWGLALLWALHPILVSAWAADMGRTHLMAATFALLALLLHVLSIEKRRPALFVAAALCLVCAMLSKVLAGWVLVAAVLEAWLIGWRGLLRSARVCVIAAICLLFGVMAYWTSLRSGLIQDASEGLFGDPVSRSALAVWIYVRNLVAPVWLSPWYLPDPLTNWSNPRVWIGLVLALATFAHAAIAWRRPDRRQVAVGWAWFWALLLPVIGLVGAREAAASDRYMYQPLMGVALVAGAVVMAAVRGQAGRWKLRPRSIIVAAGLLGAVLLLLTQPVVRICRRPVANGQRIVQLYPGDPRALEALSAQYNFARSHLLSAEDLALVPAGQTQAEYFLVQRLLTLRQAAATPNLDYFFPGPADLAPFHRRLSAAFADLRQYADALSQAQAAQRLDPDNYRTWVRLAHAYVGLGDFQRARNAFERCEQLLPSDPLAQATHYTNFGRLLLFDLQRADLALPKFRQAVALKRELPQRYQRDLAVADIGLARCEIRQGSGERGYQIIMEVLDADPQNALAGLVLAEYHFRSEHWQQAAAVYEELIRAYPTAYRWFDWYYEALRGYQWVCIRMGKLREAALMWEHAVQVEPGRRELRSFRAWSLALAGEEGADAAISELLAQEPDNRLACLGGAILALRAGAIETAVEQVDRARGGKPIPQARAFERTLWAIDRVKEQSSWPPETDLIEAAISMADGSAEASERALKKYAQAQPDSRWLYLAARVRSWAATAPAATESGKNGG
jgi:tetratricopeptide (TPR) repeat protein